MKSAHIAWGIFWLKACILLPSGALLASDPLIAAVRSGDIGKVAACYNRCDINEITEDGTPLYMAIMRGDKEVADALLANGASLVIRDSRGRTPLHWACGRNGSDKAVSTLVETYKAPLEIVDYDGRTALHLAAKTGALNRVKCLIENKASLNPMDDDGHTPLDYAKDPKVIKYLESLGAIYNKNLYDVPQSAIPTLE